MIFKSHSGLSISVVKQSSVPENKTVLFCIHGFAGSKSEWTFPFPFALADFDIVSIDLPGFGESDVPDNSNYYSALFFNELLVEIIDSFKYENNYLLGYSMGGRYVLSFLCNFQSKLSGAIIESSSPGITNQQEREKKILSDKLICGLIQEGGVEAFTDFWLAQSLFRTQQLLPSRMIEWIRNEKLKCSAKGLVHSLSEFGSGVMPSLWENIQNIKIPVMLIAGSEDKRYCTIQEKMNAIIPAAQTQIIESAGHNTHIEKPEQFANLVVSFINNIMTN